MTDATLPAAVLARPRTPAPRTPLDMSARDTARILIADDQPDILQALKLLLKSEGYEIATATSPGQIATAVTEQGVDVVLMDMNYAHDTTSGREGLDVMPRPPACRTWDPACRAGRRPGCSRPAR